ncbi:MAG: flagellar export protein FliJ [Micropepsaceae bacterium]
MKSRETLVKLHRFRADEAKTKLAGLESIRADMGRKVAELDNHLSEEGRRATENEIGRFAYPSFARSIRERKEKLAASIAEIERSIAEARIELQEAYQELKKFELAEEARVKREGEKIAQTEANAADERSLQRFIRTRNAG